jgi:hypothetical protein
MRAQWLLLGGALMLLAGSGYFALRTVATTRPVDPRAAQTPGDDSQESPVREDGTTVAVEAGLVADDQGAARSSAPRRGRVVYSSGGLVPLGSLIHPGAEPDPASQRTWWLDVTASPIAEPIEGGRYELESGLASPQDRVAFAENAVARGVRIDTELLPDIVLDPAPGLVVRVVDEAGAPVPGATLVSMGTVSIGGADRVAAVEYTSDGAGKAAISTLPGESVLRVWDQDGRTALWRGKHLGQSGEIPIILRASFSVTGSIAGMPESSSPCELQIRGPGQDWRELLAVHAIDRANFAVDSVPFTEAGTYVFRLQGPGLQPLETAVEVSAPGESVRIDFDWETGFPLRCLVLDSVEEPVDGVQLVLIWKGETGERMRYLTRTGADGHAEFEHCPDTQIWIRSYADGFIDQRWGPWAAASMTDWRIPLRLEAAGSVRGRVLFEGEPVPDFDLIYWGTDAAQHRVDTIRGAEDGRFEVAAVPLGAAYLTASTDRLPACEPVRVEVRAEPGEEVVLELTSPVVVRGKVVDASTGKGVSGAEVQVHRSYRAESLGEWGEPAMTGSDGAFEGLRLALGSNSIEISADGYSSLWLPRPMDESSPVDLGPIPVDPWQTVEVQLVSEGVVDFTRYMLTAVAKPDAAPVRFSADGLATLTEMRPDAHSLIVNHEGGQVRVAVDVVVRAGQPTFCTIPIQAGRSIRLHAVVDSGEEEAPQVYAKASYRAPNGEPVTSYHMVRDGVASINTISADRVTFSLVLVV